MKRQTLGRAGEDEAVKALARSGYRILVRNYRCRLGEVDIIAADGKTVVFVEVKTRGSDAFGAPAGGVDARKQRRIIAASQTYLAEHGLTEAPVRFDVVSVEKRDGGFAIELIADAFGA
jgi:putative endonuclease